MPDTIESRKVGKKQVAHVDLDSASLTFAPARKAGFDYISVTLGDSRPSGGFVEIYSTGVKVRLVNRDDREVSVKFESCIPIPPGSPGPTFPGPVCPGKWPFPGWPIPSRPDNDDLFLTRVVGRGVKTRAASIANSKELIAFLNQSSSEVEKLIGKDTTKSLRAITVFNQEFARSARFRADLLSALPPIGTRPPQTTTTASAREKKSKADKVGDVANAACAASTLAGPIATAAACGFALGFAIGSLIWG